MRVLTTERLSGFFLMAGTFFCPFGYDLIFKTIFDYTGSYWATTFVFYCLSGSFFGLSIFCSLLSKRKARLQQESLA
jgi:hypothetical protein